MKKDTIRVKNIHPKINLIRNPEKSLSANNLLDQLWKFPYQKYIFF